MKPVGKFFMRNSLREFFETEFRALKHSRAGFVACKAWHYICFFPRKLWPSANTLTSGKPGYKALVENAQQHQAQQAAIAREQKIHTRQQKKKKQAKLQRARRGTHPVTIAASAVLHIILLLIALPYWIPAQPAVTEKARPIQIKYIARATAKKLPAEKPQIKPVNIEPPKIVKQKPLLIEKPKIPVAKPTLKEDPRPQLKKKTKPVLGLGGSPGDSGKASPLGSRHGKKSQALAEFGGSTETETAVALGLAWLANHQNKSGAWSPSRFGQHCDSGRRCRHPGYEDYKVGVTALATLAFLGAGIDGDRKTEYQAVSRRALNYLLSQQDATGCIGKRSGNYMYNHAIAALCIAEAALLTGNRKYLDATQMALRFSARSQQPGGGWDYTATKTLRNDLSVTGWQIMLMHAAAKCGIEIDSRMEQRVTQYLRRAVRKNGWASYANKGIGEGRGGISIAAVGLLSKLYMGWSPGGEEIRNAAELIVRRGPNPDSRVDWERSFQSSYYWYYATLALFHVGGDYWDAWNTYLKRTLLPMQVRKGHERGSWKPDPNWIGAAGGRVSSTALHVLMFEAYYRYEPFYKMFGRRSQNAQRESQADR